jgi:hypothetical protein
MKRYGLILTTLATLLVTGMTLHAAGWFSSRPAHGRPLHNIGRQAAIKGDEHCTAIPTYYRQAGPRHWRDCMGQN